MLGDRWWVNQVLGAWGQAGVAAWVVWIIASICLHELAHGWAAIRKGDRTPIDTGHMTFNPVVHMGVPSLIVFALTGIAWGAMPVDPTRLRGRYAEAYVAFAGPLMNLALAALCIVGLGVVEALVNKRPITAEPSQALENMRTFFFLGGSLNIALALFNLMPVPPLDGSRILGNFSQKYRELVSTQAGIFLSMIGFALAFFFAGGVVTKAGVTVVAFGAAAIALALRKMGVA